MSVRIAFAGFRHGHIMGVYNWAKESGEVEIAAACEEDATTREQLNAGDNVEITHSNHIEMLDNAECDAVAIGEYYAARGRIAIAALERGKHVIADKPICTDLGEFGRIEILAKEKKLAVFAQFDLRTFGNFITLRKIVRDGTIGNVRAVSFGGQHPLLYGSRPAWYFEEGKQGGTINDIAVHATDLIPWATGLQFARIESARTWNTIEDVPHFNDCAQMMLTLENGAGVMGDVSYLGPTKKGYGVDQYWRTTVWGDKGIAETSVSRQGVSVCQSDSAEPYMVEPATKPDGGYYRPFLNEIRGKTDGDALLSTPEVLQASRVALIIQDAADKNLAGVDL